MINVLALDDSPPPCGEGVGVTTRNNYSRSCETLHRELELKFIDPAEIITPPLTPPRRGEGYLTALGVATKIRLCL